MSTTTKTYPMSIRFPSRTLKNAAKRMAVNRRQSVNSLIMILIEEEQKRWKAPKELTEFLPTTTQTESK